MPVVIDPVTGEAISSPGVSGKSPAYFPLDLATFDYWMTFQFYEYQMPDLISQQISNSLTSVGFPIRLPLPNSMIDANHVEYSAEGIGLAGAAAVTAAKGLSGADFSSVTSLGKTLAKPLMDTGLYALGSKLESVLNNAPGRAALATKGVALNPFLTVLFKSPAFKKHTLSWKLTPSNEPESRILNSILTKFRANMLPGMADGLGGALLTYPNIVQIDVNSSSEEYFRYTFKPAVITDVAIDFTAAGQPSFFGSTKAPTEVSLRLELMEIEYWLSRDYGLNPNSVGADFVKQLMGNTVEETPR
jgi:hypothetical protein